MLRLRTFGGISLASGEALLTGAATQRRRLALLALLAVAADRGLARDKLVAYLWPESDAERARHVLNQLVYAQRKHFGNQNLFLGQKTIRLNREVIWTDVGAFEAALESAALEEAVGYYTGPFLDGFFVRDAPEFERWVERERGRLARKCGDALTALAERAAAGGNPEGAVDWRRRALDLDPLDSVKAEALIRALADAGNVAEALRAARRHEAELRQELGVLPGPELRRLIERLSAGPPSPA
jgi:DNA-binding SARP family transcriptional activator